MKADGLAAGKGVVIAEERRDAVDALEACLVRGSFGEAGATVLVEEHLTGREVSAFALTDGRRSAPLAMAQDSKRVGTATRARTRGDGRVLAGPVRRPWDGRAYLERRLARTAEALRIEGIDYRGVLYAGLMLTPDGPRLLEYNCRFGDPETQVLMPRIAGGPRGPPGVRAGRPRRRRRGALRGGVRYGRGRLGRVSGPVSDRRRDRRPRGRDGGR